MSTAMDLVMIIARMKADGEATEDGGVFTMAGDDAVMTMGDLIATAREIVAKEDAAIRAHEISEQEKEA